MNLKKRRRIIKGLRELNLDMKIPKATNRAAYQRLCRNQKLVDVLEQMEREKERTRKHIQETFRRRVNEIING